MQQDPSGTRFAFEAGAARTGGGSGWADEQLRECESGFRYTPSSTFDTLPFPWAPGKGPKDELRVQAIAQAAKELVEQRDRWWNPQVTVTSNDEKKKRTLTNL